jgi:hypothetical protein
MFVGTGIGIPNGGGRAENPYRRIVISSVTSSGADSGQFTLEVTGVNLVDPVSIVTDRKEILVTGPSNSVPAVNGTPGGSVIFAARMGQWQSDYQLMTFEGGNPFLTLTGFNSPAGTGTVEITYDYDSCGPYFKAYLDGVFIQNVDGRDGNTFTLSGLSLESVHDVALTDAYGAQTASNTLTVTVSGNVPDAPANLIETAHDSTSVSVSFSTTGAIGVRFYVDGNQVDGSGIVSTYTFTGIDPDTTHGFGVSAYNQWGESSLSAITVSTDP